MLPMVRGAPPALVSATVCGELTVPITTVPKLRLSGVIEVEPGLMPAPVRATV